MYGIDQLISTIRFYGSIFILFTNLCQAYTSSSSSSYNRYHCYSCMSQLYRGFFPMPFGRFFNEPRNFTDQCDDPMDTRHIGVIPCATICLVVTQEFALMGKSTGRQVTMRGCAATLSKFGIYNRTLAQLDRRDICRQIDVSELVNYATTDEHQKIRVCSCLGDRCNSAAGSMMISANSPSSIITNRFVFIFLTPLLSVLVTCAVATDLIR